MEQKERKVLRELARQYREIAEEVVNEERRRRMADTNDLVTGLRPTVLIDEVPWHEFSSCPELRMVCEEPFLREMETFFRRRLFQWKYFQGDMVAEPFYPVDKRFSCTGLGIEVEEHIIRTDERNNIVSHAYVDILSREEDLEKIKPPVVSYEKEQTEKNLALAQEILGELLPARLVGTSIYCSFWDEIARFRGVEDVLYDMVDRPEFVHATVKKFADWNRSYLEQLEELNLLEAYPSLIHCTPAYTHELPGEGHQGKTRLKDVWFRGMAQMLSTVSPQMFEEFELAYMRPLMERCGLVYYGCCEPLDNRISLLAKVPNMRKLGVSPWSNVEACAQQIGSRFVAARKPNPAYVAVNLDEETVAKEIEETVRACRKYHCPYEFVLKDISTVSGKLENLVRWNRVVQETLDQYYA